MASRNKDEAIEGLLRRGLAHDASAEGACVEPEVLAAYFERSLDAGETKACERHLSRCPRCREQLAAMIRADAPSEVQPDKQTLRAWLFDWRWLTAAAAVMTLAAVWLVRRPEKVPAPARRADESVVAMNKAPAAPKPDSSIGEYDLKVLPQERRENKKALLDQLATPAKSAGVGAGPVTATKAPIPPATESVGVQSAPAANSAAATNSLDENAPANQRDLRKSESTLQRARGSETGHGFGQQQQNQASQTVTVTGQAQAQSIAPQVAPSSSAGAGNGTSEMRAKIERSNPSTVPAPAASPADGARAGVGGAVAQKPAFDDEAKQKEARQAARTVASTLLDKDAARNMQAVEERSSEKMISTPAPNVKWRIGSAGFVERSVDGGATWTGQEVDPTGSPLLAGSAPDDKTCWLVGRAGAVFVTKDAASWKKTSAPAPADLVAVWAKDGSSAIVTTADGRHFSTHDRGKKWKLETRLASAKPQE